MMNRRAPRPYFPLDPLQIVAAEGPVASEGPTVVLGAHGTGKTHAMVGRILFLLDHDVDPGSVTYLASSSRVAENFRQRLDRLPQEYSESARGVFVGTPAQFALHFLRRAGAGILEMSPRFTLRDRPTSVQVILEICCSDPNLQQVDVDTIEAFLDWLAASPVKGADKKIPPPHPACDRLMGRYAREKRRRNVLGIEDLVPAAVNALEKDPNIRSRWAGLRSRHLMVDGVQDTPPAHRGLIDLMTCPEGSMTVTLDPNQAIFERLGADPEARWILDRAKPEDIRLLAINHRSLKALADPARTLSRSPSLRGLVDDKQVPIRVRDSQPPTIARFYADDEADNFLVEQIKQLKERGWSWEDMMVICRDPADVTRVRSLLDDQNISYHAWGAGSWTTDPDLRRVLSMLSSVLNPVDDKAFFAAAFDADSHRRVAVRQVMANLTSIVQDQGIDLFEAARRQLPAFEPGGAVHEGLQRMVDAQEELTRLLESSLTTLPEAVRLCADLLQGYPADGPLSQLLTLTESIVRERWETPRDHFIRLLDQAHPDLYGSTLSPDAGITVTTIDEARGMERAILLYLDSDVPNEGRSQAEENRMRYLAYTRASDLVYFIVSMNRANRVDPWPWQVADVLDHPDATLEPADAIDGGVVIPKGCHAGHPQQPQHVVTSGNPTQPPVRVRPESQPISSSTPVGTRGQTPQQPAPVIRASGLRAEMNRQAREVADFLYPHDRDLDNVRTPRGCVIAVALFAAAAVGIFASGVCGVLT